jgi:hypothetical protein
MSCARGKDTCEALETCAAISWQVTKNSELLSFNWIRYCTCAATARKEALRRGAANSMRKADVGLESGKYQ